MISGKMSKKRQNEVKRNKILFDEVKKHNRTNSEIQSKELNERLTTTPLDQQISSPMSTKKTNNLKS